MRSLISKILASFGVQLADDVYDKMDKFSQYLLEENQKHNLTGITEPREVAIKHFCDSLSLLKYKQFSQTDKMLDLGTGAGFPGIPLAIVRPDVSVVLLDSSLKKVKFCQRAADLLGLSNVSAIHARAEDLALEAGQREVYDLVVSRAVAHLPVLCEYCLPFVAVGGNFLAMKGPAVTEELTAAQKAISLLGGRVKEVDSFKLSSDYSRSIVIIDKLTSTPKQYPRRAGTPKKEPLL